MNMVLRPFGMMFPGDIFEDDKFWSGFNTQFANRAVQGFPKYDQYEQEGNRVIEVALAGYSREQLSVEVQGNKLTIAGNKAASQTDEQRVFAHRSFVRSFTDTSKVWDLNAAEVSFVDGLLKVKIPPMKQLQPEKKTLEIQ